MTIRKEPKNKNKIFVDFSHFTLDFVLTMRIRRTQDDTVIDKKRDTPAEAGRKAPKRPGTTPPGWTVGTETAWIQQ